ncbi:hypothetical protein SVA_2344 [Sulfurifustis variabilis]|uniref:Uncharacterized protein n=1 Tax=Sulfurifustis variabilis TaxID=1675686 RepID=A0A1B4VAS1_9GAMM|nr:DUF6494 family protein [Sulfurifustis variabilis]BAU48894.1 hypothetical protein SVA_2344 [Sulfurifustis variabilis]
MNGKTSLDEERLNLEIRKFLKKVGITSQREIERAVREAVAAGRLKGNETLPVRMDLSLPGAALSYSVSGEIELGE